MHLLLHPFVLWVFCVFSMISFVVPLYVFFVPGCGMSLVDYSLYPSPSLSLSFSLSRSRSRSLYFFVSVSLPLPYSLSHHTCVTVGQARLTPGCNVVGYIDRGLFGEHMYGISQIPSVWFVATLSSPLSPLVLLSLLSAYPTSFNFLLWFPRCRRQPTDTYGLFSVLSSITVCFIGLQFGIVTLRFQFHNLPKIIR